MTLLLKPSMQWHFHNMKCWKLLLKLYAVCFNMSISIRHVVHAFKCFLLVLEADTILHQHYRFRLNYCHVSSHWFSLARTDRNGSSPSTYRQRIQEKKQEIERCGGLASHVGIDIWLYDICIIVLSYCIVCPDFVEWYEWCWMNDSCNSHTTYLTRLPIHSRISWDSSPLNLTGGELLFMPLLDQTQLGLCWSCQTRLLHGPLSKPSNIIPVIQSEAPYPPKEMTLSTPSFWARKTWQRHDLSPRLSVIQSWSQYHLLFLSCKRHKYEHACRCIYVAHSCETLIVFFSMFRPQVLVAKGKHGAYQIW